MEAQKRKCSDDREVETKKQKKMAKADGRTKEAAVEDDKVEEFYAILRRIRVAVKYFGKGNADGIGVSGHKLTAAMPNSVFRPENSREVNDVKAQESTEDNASLDLNADPDDL